MRQKGFATIFGLCLMLVVALIVKGIQEAEANHAREVVNFETEQALQLAAESAIVEAAESVRNGVTTLPISNGVRKYSQRPIPVGEPKNKKISVEVWGERGKIYVNNLAKDGVYFMSRATIDGGFFGEKIYRRAFAYVLSTKHGNIYDDGTTIHFMELP